MSNLKITQTRSVIGRPEKHRLIVKGLGLKRIRHTVVRSDNESIRGALFKVQHLVSWVETDEAVTPGKHRQGLTSKAQS